MDQDCGRSIVEKKRCSHTKHTVIKLTPECQATYEKIIQPQRLSNGFILFIGERYGNEETL